MDVARRTFSAAGRAGRTRRGQAMIETVFIVILTCLCFLAIFSTPPLRLQNDPEPRRDSRRARPGRRV
jgi:hypothetical protein